MDDFLALVFAPLLALLIFPYAAAIPAFGFFVVYWRTGQWVSLIAAVLWALYGVHETLMYLRITCTGECNIRIDLLLIFPALALVTLLAIGWALCRLWRRRA